MGLLDALMGNASEVDVAKVQGEFAQILAAEERIEKAYQLIRDMFLFTNRRLIFVNRQGLTGSKVEYLSIPYRSIVRFSVETAGHFDRDAELRGSSEPSSSPRSSRSRSWRYGPRTLACSSLAATWDRRKPAACSRLGAGFTPSGAS